MRRIPEQRLDELAELIMASRRLFVAGAGRSGLMMRAFAMRLVHLGFETYVVGETVTPALEAGDLLILGSGSGETRSLVSIAEKASSLQAAIALITVAPDSSLRRLAQLAVPIPAAVKTEATDATVQPMGSLFEQSLLIVLDAVVLKMMRRQGIEATAMMNRHANLE